MWNETEGKRGTVEIDSCGINNLKNLGSKLNDKELDVVYYSDNCCGQQNNYIFGIQVTNCEIIVYFTFIIERRNLTF